MGEWQICFEVKGLIAPEKPLKFDDKIAFKKTPRPKVPIYIESDDRSIVFFKVFSDEAPEFNIMHQRLQDFLYFYGLVTGQYVECPNQQVAIQITESCPFGEVLGLSKIFDIVKLTDEKKEHYNRLLKYSMQTFKKFGSIFTDSSKRYLKNAIIYYYRALKDLSRLSNEEALIDEMISLESLLGANSYRLSLRASILLRLEGKEKASDIQQKIKDLYEKRSKIVHGSEKISLKHEEVFELAKYTNNIIFILLNFNKPREEITSLVDNSILDLKEKQSLEQLYSRHFHRIEK